MNVLKSLVAFRLIVVLLVVVPSILSLSPMPVYSYSAYDIGSPTLQDIWVDPLSGNDAQGGSSRSDALRTVSEAWNRIPSNETLSSTGYRIMLVSGDYPADSLPGWMEFRFGTYQYPVIFEAADGPHTVRFHGYLDISGVSYFYLLDIDFVTDFGTGGGANVVHFAGSHHILIRGCSLNGFDGLERQPQETLKVNQVQYMYVEDSDIQGAFWFPLDFVAVQYGHVINNTIHNSGDDCVVLKGGTAYLTIEGNEVYDCGVIGLGAGQGTGYEYMASPWLHYEAYDLKFINNVVHDVQNAGIAVRGGYNIVFAYNTLYRIGIGSAGSGMLLVGQGARGCDGNAAECLARNIAGGWGPASPEPGGEWIPNRNVYIYNNIFYNPAGVQTLYSHFDIFGPVNPPAGTNIPSPSATDTNLQIRGNIIWNGNGELPLGIEDTSQGCQPVNPSCNAIQLLAENSIHVFEPHMLAPQSNDFHLFRNSNNLGSMAFSIPLFPGGDRPMTPPTPEGDLVNSVDLDRDQTPRDSVNPAGAYTLCHSTPVRILNSPYATIQSAYAGAVVGGGSTLEIIAEYFSEALAFDQEISVSLQGGYRCGFGQSDSFTTVRGSLLIQEGSVDVSKVIIR
ncbi:MAG: right-handed parallel beta-helix repeat-containing protein [Thermodesulfovibrio sp.]|nr:right-handed parallel beta-helix repeat-containing protein [Thermodesulfovibrio sp.]